MTTKLDEIAKKFIEGEWLYNAEEKTLKKTFASDKELSELKLIDSEGCLNPTLKAAMIKILGKDVLKNVVGPFDDNDIFSGDVLDDLTVYNVELYQVSDINVDALSEIANVTISDKSDS